jgi:hypothetical protein
LPLLQKRKDRDSNIRSKGLTRLRWKQWKNYALQTRKMKSQISNKSSSNSLLATYFTKQALKNEKRLKSNRKKTLRKSRHTLKNT